MTKIPKWYERFTREMHAIGCTADVIDGEDVEWSIPKTRMEEAKAIIAKYMTPEAKKEHGL